MIKITYSEDAQGAMDAIDKLIVEYRDMIVSRNIDMNPRDLHNLINEDEDLFRLRDSKTKIMQYSIPTYTLESK